MRVCWPRAHLVRQHKTIFMIVSCLVLSVSIGKQWPKNYHILTPVLHAVIESQGILGVGKLNKTMKATRAWLVSLWPGEQKPSSTSIISWLLVNEVWECQTGLWAITPPPSIPLSSHSVKQPDLKAFDSLTKATQYWGGSVWSGRMLKFSEIQPWCPCMDIAL